MARELLESCVVRVLAVVVLLSSLLLLAPACGGGGGGGGGHPDASAQHIDAMPGGPLKFMDQCDPQNDMCDTANGDTCYTFGMGGSYCTHSCTGPSDCPAPSTGCNGMGVCKRPQ